MAPRSASFRYWVLRNTTSAMGPVTDPRGATPVRSSATTSSCGQPATRLGGGVEAGAYQFCTGMSPPRNACDSLVAPKALRGLWQAAQWPRPCTR